jgi:hypothetical protein
MVSKGVHMQPFGTTTIYHDFGHRFPDLKALLSIQNSWDDVQAVARQWLTEGIPYAFIDNPFLYEAIRAWLAKNIQVNPKEITLIGSARLGYAISTGKKFSPNSDLDLTCISDSIFKTFISVFQQWKQDYEDGRIHPDPYYIRKYWDDNLENVPNNIRHGFIDTNRVPNLSQYPVARMFNNTLWLLKAKLDITSGAPKIRKGSLRIYKDWNSFITQLALNLSKTLNHWSTPSS